VGCGGTALTDPYILNPGTRQRLFAFWPRHFTLNKDQIGSWATPEIGDFEDERKLSLPASCPSHYIL